MEVEKVLKGSRVGVNRDGSPVGHAVKVPGGKPERWTAFIYITEPPFDVARPGFATADEAADYIAVHGATPAHLVRTGA